MARCENRHIRGVAWARLQCVRHEWVWWRTSTWHGITVTVTVTAAAAAGDSAGSSAESATRLGEHPNHQAPQGKRAFPPALWDSRSAPRHFTATEFSSPCTPALDTSATGSTTDVGAADVGEHRR